MGHPTIPARHVVQRARLLCRALLLISTSALFGSCLNPDTGEEVTTGPGSSEYSYIVVAGSLNLYPDFTVTVNGEARGRVTQGYSYFSRTCASANSLASNQVVKVPVKVGETVTIRAVFPSKRFYYWNNLSPTNDMLKRASCEWLDVPEEPVDLTP